MGKYYQVTYSDPTGTVYDSATFLKEALGIENVTETPYGAQFTITEDKAIPVFETIFTHSKWKGERFSDKVSHLKPILRHGGVDTSTFTKLLAQFSTSIRATSTPFGKAMPILLVSATTDTSIIDKAVEALSQTAKDYKTLASSITTIGEGKYSVSLLFSTTGYKVKDFAEFHKALQGNVGDTLTIKHAHILCADSTDKDIAKAVELVNKGEGVWYMSYDEDGKPIPDSEEIVPLTECLTQDETIKTWIPIGYYYSETGKKPLTQTSRLYEDLGK